MAFKAFRDSACVSSIDSKRYPRSGLSSLENMPKSYGHHMNSMVMERNGLNFEQKGLEEPMHKLSVFGIKRDLARFSPKKYISKCD